MTDDLIEDFFSNRPDDDELAFVYYEKSYRNMLDKALVDCENGQSYQHYRQTYVNKVMATVVALELPILGYWVENSNLAKITSRFDEVCFDIDAEVTQIKIRHAQRIRKSSVHLDNQTKEGIRDLIGKIKTTLDAAILHDGKKEALFSKLNAFADEVDRDRTKFEAFSALVIEAAGTIGKAESKIRPIRRWIESIAALLHEAKSFEILDKRLPAKVEPKRITERKTSKAEEELDDKIPF